MYLHLRPETPKHISHLRHKKILFSKRSHSYPRHYTCVSLAFTFSRTILRLILENRTFRRAWYSLYSRKRFLSLTSFSLYALLLLATYGTYPHTSEYKAVSILHPSILTEARARCNANSPERHMANARACPLKE